MSQRVADEEKEEEKEKKRRKSRKRSEYGESGREANQMSLENDFKMDLDKGYKDGFKINN